MSYSKLSLHISQFSCVNARQNVFSLSHFASYPSLSHCITALSYSFQTTRQKLRIDRLFFIPFFVFFTSLIYLFLQFSPFFFFFLTLCLQYSLILHDFFFSSFHSSINEYTSLIHIFFIFKITHMYICMCIRE